MIDRPEFLSEDVWDALDESSRKMINEIGDTAKGQGVLKRYINRNIDSQDHLDTLWRTPYAEKKIRNREKGLSRALKRAVRFKESVDLAELSDKVLGNFLYRTRDDDTRSKGRAAAAKRVSRDPGHTRGMKLARYRNNLGKLSRYAEEIDLDETSGDAGDRTYHVSLAKTKGSRQAKKEMLKRFDRKMKLGEPNFDQHGRKRDDLKRRDERTKMKEDLSLDELSKETLSSYIMKKGNRSDFSKKGPGVDDAYRRKKGYFYSKPKGRFADYRAEEKDHFEIPDFLKRKVDPKQKKRPISKKERLGILRDTRKRMKGW